jgi:cytochrome b561
MHNVDSPVVGNIGARNGPPQRSTTRGPGAAAPTDARYTGVAIAVHWLVAVLVVVQIAWGWAMQEIPRTPPGLRADAFNLHKSIGLTILVLMLFRIAWRLRHPPPALPPLPRWQRVLARGNHALLYTALVVMPVAGYLGSVFSGYPVKLFGLTLPAWGGRDESIKAAMSAIHLVTSWILLGAMALHVAAALRHALDDGDRVLRRMLPYRATRRSQRERGVVDAIKVE